jgi:hypothetical protein
MSDQKVPTEIHISEVNKSDVAYDIQRLDDRCQKYLLELKLVKGNVVTIPKPVLDR